MREFTVGGERAIHDVARRHDFSPGAVASMLRAVLIGRGRMAQFNHPEFGGSGQWMRGGMTMISDMFNATLKARVERLCDELSRLVASDPGIVDDARASAAAGDPVSFFVAEPVSTQSSWWPAELGHPNSAGAQNDMRYAYFAQPRRLAIDIGGDVTIYDTLDHRIGGVAQQQSGSRSLTFTGQHGVVDVAVLPKVSATAKRPASTAAAHAQTDVKTEAKAVPEPDVVGTIEKLAELHRKGILTEAEFSAKKTELLGRL
jgi:hypothetical protein